MRSHNPANPRKNVTPWPCGEQPGNLGTGPNVDDCPGNGPNGTHCAACHRLYFGYVALCPMHAAAPELLKAARALDACWDDEDVNGSELAMQELRAVLAKAGGEGA